MDREMTLCFKGLPTSFQYCLASFQAVSTASPPPVVKKTRLRSPGAPAARRSASSIARGWAYDQSGKKASSRARAAGFRGGALCELRPPVADLDGEQPGQPVEVPLALIVVNVRTLTPDDDRHVP